ncbi:MAG: Spy/CpxP family protein refolding chaperone [Chthoniobacterales bacterium]
MNTTRLSLLAGAALVALLPLSPLCAQTADAPKPKGPSVEERVAKMKENLSLTDDQVKAVTGIFQDQKTKMDAVRADTTLTKDQVREKVKPIMADTKTKVEAVLTPEQKAKAEQLHKERMDKQKAGKDSKAQQ